MSDPAPSAMPSSRSDPEAAARDALIAIKYNADLARHFTLGLTSAEFSKSSLHFYAVVRALEIISEASRRLPEAMRDRHPQLPWRAIKDAGNVYRHRYDNVVHQQIWKTVQQDLQPLSEMAGVELATIGYSAPPPDVPLTDTEAWLQGVGRHAPGEADPPAEPELDRDDDLSL